MVLVIPGGQKRAVGEGAHLPAELDHRGILASQAPAFRALVFPGCLPGFPLAFVFQGDLRGEPAPAHILLLDPTIPSHAPVIVRAAPCSLLPGHAVLCYVSDAAPASSGRNVRFLQPRGSRLAEWRGRLVLAARRRLIAPIRAKRCRPGTVADYATKVRAFHCWLEGWPVNAETVAAYREHLRERTSRATVRGYLAALSTWFAFLGRSGYPDLPPVPAPLDPDESRQGKRA